MTTIATIACVFIPRGVHGKRTIVELFKSLLIGKEAEDGSGYTTPVPVYL